MIKRVIAKGKRAGVSLALLVLGLAGCANGSSGSPSFGPVSPAPTPSEIPQVDSPPIDWDNPIDGVPVASLDAAQASSPFALYEPQNLPTPTSIIVNPTSGLPRLSVVAFVYDTNDFGRVVVKEHLPDVPAKDYEATNREMLELNGQPYVHGMFDLVTIRGGSEALITTSEDGKTSSIFWLEGPIEVVIRGPALAKAAVVKLAESI